MIYAVSIAVLLAAAVLLLRRTGKKEKRKLDIRCEYDMAVFGDPSFPGTYTVLLIKNISGEPIVISSARADMRDNRPQPIMRASPSLPYELLPGYELEIFADQSSPGFLNLESFTLTDTRGRTYIYLCRNIEKRVKSLKG